MDFVKEFFTISLGIRLIFHGVRAMNSKGPPSVLIALSILLIAQTSLTKENTAKHHLTIVYTNDVQGEIEPCG